MEGVLNDLWVEKNIFKVKNFYALNNKYIYIKYIKGIDEIIKKKYMAIVGDFNRPFPVIVKTNKRKISKGIENLNNMMYKLDLMNIHRKTQPKSEHVFWNANMTYYQNQLHT